MQWYKCAQKTLFSSMTFMEILDCTAWVSGYAFPTEAVEVGQDGSKTARPEWKHL